MFINVCYKRGNSSMLRMNTTEKSGSISGVALLQMTFQAFTVEEKRKGRRNAYIHGNFSSILPSHLYIRCTNLHQKNVYCKIQSIYPKNTRAYYFNAFPVRIGFSKRLNGPLKPIIPGHTHYSKSSQFVRKIHHKLG